jgi:L-ascorbate metabolism protein UlaG (beta-lactamase superfamily)
MKWLQLFKRILIFLVSIVLALLFAFLLFARHVPYEIPAHLRGPMALREPIDGGISLKYLGVSGYEISDGINTVLLDPTPTRPLPLALLKGPIDSDDAIATTWCPKADLILVNHTHFDHALDVASIAKRTGAQIWGSQSTVNLALSRGVNPEQTKVVHAGDSLIFKGFKIDVVNSRHTDIAGISNPMSGTISPTAGPLYFWEYTIDETLAFRLEAHGTSIWWHPTSTFSTGELHALEATNLIVGVTGEKATPEKALAIFGEAKPMRIFPTHYDNFFQPIKKGLAKMPELDFESVFQIYSALPGKPDFVTLDYGETIFLGPD